MRIVRRYYRDDETGEILTYSTNQETGEPCLCERIEPTFLGSEESEIEPEPALLNLPRGCGYDKKNIQSLKENIMEGSNKVSYILFLIPTLILWPAFMCAFLMFLEIYLHIKCHKENKLLKNDSVYYRSPFHPVTSTFCAICRETDSASKVGQLQDQRRIRYDYFKKNVLLV